MNVCTILIEMDEEMDLYKGNPECEQYQQRAQEALGDEVAAAVIAAGKSLTLEAVLQRINVNP